MSIFSAVRNLTVNPVSQSVVQGNQRESNVICSVKTSAFQRGPES